MSNFKGWLGEKKAAFSMWLSLNKRSYPRFHNVILPATDGSTQIDHILISQNGIFIVETKNISGWIFGSESQARWTQILYREKYSFQNPLRQTYRQKIFLADFLHVKKSYIDTVIYFVGNCEFKTEMPSNVIRYRLGKYIKSFKEQRLSQEEVDRIVKLLKQHTSESKISTKDHVRSLERRHNLSRICPKCGGRLKIKVAKKGPNGGTMFLGCANYPRCRFTRNS